MLNSINTSPNSSPITFLAVGVRSNLQTMLVGNLDDFTHPLFRQVGLCVLKHSAVCGRNFYHINSCPNMAFHFGGDFFETRNLHCDISFLVFIKYLTESSRNIAARSVYV